MPDEGAVDLERSEREPLEGCQGRIAGAEIVEAKCDAHPSQLSQGLDGELVLVVQEHVLGYLDPETARSEPVLVEQILKEREEIGFGELVGATRSRRPGKDATPRNSSFQAAVCLATSAQDIPTEFDDHPVGLGQWDDFGWGNRAELWM